MSWVNTVHGFLSLGWVGSTIGIAGTALAIYLYLISRQRTRLSTAYDGHVLLGPIHHEFPAEISMQYKGSPIPQLTKSRLVVWNSGEKTISNDDIVKSDPLQILIPEGGKILSASLVKISRTVNEPTLKITNSELCELSFDFLDSGDGAIIEILHTSSKIRLSIHGTIRGLPKGIKSIGAVNIPRTRATSIRWIQKLEAHLNTIFIIIFTPAALTMLLRNLPPYTEQNLDTGITALTMSAINLVMIIFMTQKHRNRLPKFCKEID